MAVTLAATGGVARAASCTVTPTGAAFGTYDPSSPINTTTLATITVSCQATLALTIPFSLSLSGGNSGRVAARTLSSGTSRLNYGIYTDLAHSTVWGDGSGGSSTVSASVIITTALTPGSAVATAYAQIPAGQLATPGNYTDTILVTVSY